MAVLWRSLLCALTAVLVAAGATGCQSGTPATRLLEPGRHPDAGPPDTPGLSSGEIRQAVRLYTAQCSRCHSFYDPANYSDAEWAVWMAKMTRKSRLKPDQEQLLSRYLESYRNASNTAPTQTGRTP